MPRTKDDPDVVIYAEGLVAASACAPAALGPDAVADAVNEQQPTGVTSTWLVSSDPFCDGSPNPHTCEQEPERQHWLLEC